MLAGNDMNGAIHIEIYRSEDIVGMWDMKIGVLEGFENLYPVHVYNMSKKDILELISKEMDNE